MNKLFYYILYGSAWLYSVLPLRVMYILSDFSYIFVYYIARYRRELARRNLVSSFPGKTKEEILKIEKAFYHHLCDYFFETIKLLHISDEEMRRRFVFNGIDQTQKALDDGRSCIMMLGHYGNWEWVTSITLWVKGKDAVIGQIYRPLKNKAFDLFFLKLRKRFHSSGITKDGTYREIIKMRKDKINWLLGFISDQKPSPRNSHYWTDFLNHETSVLIGAERIAKQTDAVVYYLDVKRVKRGYYESEVKLITDKSGETAEFEITEKYIRMMEDTILRNPSYWLWTHNRWKHKKENSQ